MGDLRGRFVLLNFWGEWCGPCLAEIPHLVDLAESYSSDSLRIVGFLETQRVDRARRVMEKHGMDWPQVRLSDTLKDRFGIVGFPTNVLIHPDGTEFTRMNVISRRVLEESLPPARGSARR